MSEFFTRIKYKNREEWLNGRQKGLGGSDAGAIIGVNKWKSNTELYAELIGEATPEDISEKPAVKYGTNCEPSLRQLFRYDFPEMKVYSREYEILQNNALPFLMASVDGELTDPEGRKGILEIKTTTIWQPRYLAQWENRIPDTYYCQILHYMIVTRYEFVKVKALINLGYRDDKLQQVRHYHFERRECEDDMRYLLNEEIKFWKHVEHRQKPARILSK